MKVARDTKSLQNLYHWVQSLKNKMLPCTLCITAIALLITAKLTFIIPLLYFAQNSQLEKYQIRIFQIYNYYFYLNKLHPWTSTACEAKSLITTTLGTTVELLKLRKLQK